MSHALLSPDTLQSFSPPYFQTRVAVTLVLILPPIAAKEIRSHNRQPHQRDAVSSGCLRRVELKSTQVKVGVTKQTPSSHQEMLPSGHQIKEITRVQAEPLHHRALFTPTKIPIVLWTRILGCHPSRGLDSQGDLTWPCGLPTLPPLTHS